MAMPAPQNPIMPGSFRLAVNGEEVTGFAVDFDTGVIGVDPAPAPDATVAVTFTTDGTNGLRQIEESFVSDGTGSFTLEAVPMTEGAEDIARQVNEMLAAPGEPRPIVRFVEPTLEEADDGSAGLLPPLDQWVCPVCGQQRMNDGTACRFCSNTGVVPMRAIDWREIQQSMQPRFGVLVDEEEKKTRAQKQVPVIERDRLLRKVDF